VLYCADDLLNSRHTFRAWWPAVLWDGLLLFWGTKGYSQMMTMNSNNIGVKNNPFCGFRAFLTEIYTPIYKDFYPQNRTNWSFLMLRCSES